MDRTTAKVLREKLNNLFAEHGIEGFDITVGNASYDDVSVTFKVALTETGAGSAEERDLEKYAGLYDLDTSKVADLRGNKYSLVGYKRSARTKCWIMQKLGVGGSNNKYVTDTDTAKRLFGKDVA
jgi:hypothetical protein